MKSQIKNPEKSSFLPLVQASACTNPLFHRLAGASQRVIGNIKIDLSIEE